MSEARFNAAHHVLDAGEIHVWRAPPTSDFPSVERLTACLSHEEKLRAGLARDAAARARFITARVALRHILARYLQRDPHALDLRVEPRGKPVVDAALGIHFSLSHARDITLLAFAAAPVGIDVEQFRPLRNLMLVARRVLHGDTCRTLEQAAPHERATLFLHAWTLREAHVKAVGGGLFHTADTVPFAPLDDPARGAIAHVHDRDDDALWSIAHIQPDDTSIAAVIARGAMHTLRSYSWIPEHGDTP